MECFAHTFLPFYVVSRREMFVFLLFFPLPRPRVTPVTPPLSEIQKYVPPASVKLPRGCEDASIHLGRCIHAARDAEERVEAVALCCDGVFLFSLEECFVVLYILGCYCYCCLLISAGLSFVINVWHVGNSVAAVCDLGARDFDEILLWCSSRKIREGLSHHFASYRFVWKIENTEVSNVCIISRKQAGPPTSNRPLFALHARGFWWNSDTV